MGQFGASLAGRPGSRRPSAESRSHDDATNQLQMRASSSATTVPRNPPCVDRVPTSPRPAAGPTPATSGRGGRRRGGGRRRSLRGFWAGWAWSRSLRARRRRRGRSSAVLDGAEPSGQGDARGGIDTLADANRFLDQYRAPLRHEWLVVVPQDSCDAHRPLLPEVDLEALSPRR